MPFLTFDNWAGSDTRLVSISHNLRRYLLPLLDQMLESSRWETFGNCPVADIMDAVRQLEDDLYSGRVGTILATVGDIPDNALPCDGSTYTRSQYPALWDAIAPIFKSGDNFTVPDLGGRFLAGGANIGETGGESSHTLTIDEIPAHTHSSHAHLPIEASGEIPTEIPDLAFPFDTGSAGGGEPHNNMPPYIVVSFYIIFE